MFFLIGIEGVKSISFVGMQKRWHLALYKKILGGIFIIAMHSSLANADSVKTIDLTGLSIGLIESDSWLGRDVTSVIDVDSVETIIMLKAMTSAPVGIDANNILRAVERATKFETPTQGLFERTVWHAVIVTKNGEYIQYVSDGDWAHITKQSGGGFFRWNSNE